jgi:small GTP-binding protein
MFDGNQVKLIVIGDSTVGKTQMMLRFTDDTFSATALSTIGVDFKSKDVQIEGVAYRIQIWDTAGQERFRNITEAYYRKAHGIAIVFDVSQAGTFENVPSWFDSVANKCEATAVPVVLIGNKCDLEPQITYEQGVEAANKHNVPFYHTSAKTGDGIEEAFMDLATRVARANEAKNSASDARPTVDLRDKEKDQKDKKKFKC